MSGNQMLYFDDILSQCEFRAQVIPSDIPNLKLKYFLR